MKIKSILVSQPAPNLATSPYGEIVKKAKVKIDFRPFIHVEGADAKELRAQKIDLSQYTGIIFTSKNAIDHYFRLAEEMRFAVPDTMRYICQSEAIANYLQKHIVYRKRKISFGGKTAKDLLPLLKKHHTENYLLPSSDVFTEDLPKVLNEVGVEWKRAIMYRTVCSDLKDMSIDTYDLIIFFSPQGVRSLFENFPDFKQENTKIGVFGLTTQQAAEELGLHVDLMAPTKESPSMTMALERFITANNK
ncbi:uroporphyrinogen-III synthase [Elizabethkingia argentiflava]|uniref:Uroporphyrinogen-III synthase n=1 Tax=Elizabethkingia argenteiflava TaxID=2681556 RepID=A0A845PZ76_9FLAO|nr:uroporphyrinogen-III synthase [Elizabethkingia argenteiflava]NAW51668.1 uroporphyrinogen-III synthase [Elizabethkingia argenteiflava]